VPRRRISRAQCRPAADLARVPRQRISRAQCSPAAWGVFHVYPEKVPKLASGEVAEWLKALAC
jgi:hypothetical protein